MKTVKRVAICFISMNGRCKHAAKTVTTFCSCNDICSEARTEEITGVLEIAH